jgi:hypothetical protein
MWREKAPRALSVRRPGINPDENVVGIFLTQRFPNDRVFYNEFIMMVYRMLMD